MGLSGNYTDTEFTKVSLDVPTYVNRVLKDDPVPDIPQYSYSVDTRYDFNWSSEVSGLCVHMEYNRQVRRLCHQSNLYVPQPLQVESYRTA